MNIERSINRLPKKAAIPAFFLAAILSGCSGNVAPEPSSTYSPFPISTEKPDPTYPPMEPVPTVVYPTLTPKPTADPNIKCDPRLVPDATPVAAVTNEPSKSFTLHVPVLEYHRIAGPKAKGKADLKVPPATFDAQMKIMSQNGWHTITLAELGYDLEHEITPDPKTFVLTFDDGYNDNENILPILQRYGDVGTFFVITGRSGGSFLRPDQIKALAAAGNEIASHTVDHVSITSGKADYEVDKSAEDIAKITGKWPSTFAYPFGSENSYARKAVSRCTQMRMAVTTVQAVGETWDKRFEVPRLKVLPGTSPKTLLKELTPYAGK